MASLKALTVEYLNTSNNVLTVHNHSLWYNILTLYKWELKASHRLKQDCCVLEMFSVGTIHVMSLHTDTIRKNMIHTTRTLPVLYQHIFSSLFIAFCTKFSVLKVRATHDLIQRTGTS